MYIIKIIVRPSFVYRKMFRRRDILQKRSGNEFVRVKCETVIHYEKSSYYKQEELLNRRIRVLSGELNSFIIYFIIFPITTISMKLDFRLAHSLNLNYTDLTRVALAPRRRCVRNNYNNKLCSARVLLYIILL